MSDELELKTIQVVSNNNNIASDVRVEQVSSGNGARSDNVNTAHEVSPLLSTPQVGDANNAECSDVTIESVNSSKPRWRDELQRVKRELNEVAVWKLKKWMVILIVLLLIALIIAVSFIVCAAGHVDEDETYDRSSFVVERFFRGNFTLANSFISHPETQAEEREKLLEELKHQLTTVYNSSSALARYFSSVTINSFSDDTAQFELQFIIPSENEQLVRYTLSREMVKNVLFQHFYDQDPAGNSLYVKPTSLTMEVWTRGT
nr:TPA-induced transmembrane protein isoform X1 [Misgurnus anguillicaudatus]